MVHKSTLVLLVFVGLMNFCVSESYTGLLNPGETVTINRLTFDATEISLEKATEIYVKEVTQEEIGLDFHPVYNQVSSYYQYGSLKEVFLFHNWVKVSVPLPEGISTNELRVLFYNPPGSSTHSNEPSWSASKASYDRATHTAFFPTNYFGPDGIVFTLAYADK